MISERLLTALDAKSLVILAADHERAARNLRLKAAQKRLIQSYHKDAPKHFDQLDGLAGKVQGFLDQGDNLDTAIVKTGRATHSPVETIRFYWHRHQKAGLALRKVVRDARIVTLAGRGFTHAEIAKRVKPPLHPGSVRRIIRRALDRDEAEADANSRALGRSLDQAVDKILYPDAPRNKASTKA